MVVDNRLIIANTANTMLVYGTIPHPYKDIEKAIRCAESRSRRVLVGGSHA
jgi:hypothetical protein